MKSLPANTFYTEFDTATLGARPQKAEDRRNAFQIDRDRILFSTPFRQLQSKTQVFQSGQYDFYRTRLTHTIEVARIARSIAEHLNQTSPHLRDDYYLDPDLVEAVGLAHDLGHPPFGHIGERILNELLAPWGGFEGNAQSLKILTEAFYQSGAETKGMGPTRALLDGVLKYSPLQRECREQTGAYPDNHFLYDEQAAVRAFIWGREFAVGGRRPPHSIECQIMDWADDAAYSLHDIVDGIRARFITLENLHRWRQQQGERLDELERKLLDRLKNLIEEGRFEPYFESRLGRFIHACRLEPDTSSPLAEVTARHRFRLDIDAERVRECRLYKRLAFELIFQSAPIQQIEFKGARLLTQLHEAFARQYLDPAGVHGLKLLPEPLHTRMVQTPELRARQRLLCDFLASQTDASAGRLHQRLYSAEPGQLADLG